MIVILYIDGSIRRIRPVEPVHPNRLTEYAKSLSTKPFTKIQTENLTLLFKQKL